MAVLREGRQRVSLQCPSILPGTRSRPQTERRIPRYLWGEEAEMSQGGETEVVEWKFSRGETWAGKKASRPRHRSLPESPLTTRICVHSPNLGGHAKNSHRFIPEGGASVFWNMLVASIWPGMSATGWYTHIPYQSLYTRVLALTLNSSFLLICKTSLTGKVVGLLPPMQEIEFDFLSPSSGCGCSAQLRPAPASADIWGMNRWKAFTLSLSLLSHK